jgi:hypothetical protein
MRQRRCLPRRPAPCPPERQTRSDFDKKANDLVAQLMEDRLQWRDRARSQDRSWRDASVQTSLMQASEMGAADRGSPADHAPSVSAAAAIATDPDACRAYLDFSRQLRARAEQAEAFERARISARESGGQHRSAAMSTKARAAISPPDVGRFWRRIRTQDRHGVREGASCLCFDAPC